MHHTYKYVFAHYVHTKSRSIVTVSCVCGLNVIFRDQRIWIDCLAVFGVLYNIRAYARQLVAR